MIRAALQLSSAKNPRVKEVAELIAERKERTRRGLFAVEGAREIRRAHGAGCALRQVFACPAKLSAEAEVLLREWERVEGVERFEVTAPVFARLAVRDGSDGLVAVFAQRAHTLADFRPPERPLLLAVVGVEKPGNLGALLRSADGAGVDGVVVLDGSVDLYNPHVIRGSVGAVFGLSVVTAGADEFRAFCKERGIALVAAALADRARPYHEVDLTRGCALLLGSEADGLPADWVAAADDVVRIPMLGSADSLNVSAAGAVLLYEARRQRLQKA